MKLRGLYTTSIYLFRTVVLLVLALCMISLYKDNTWNRTQPVAGISSINTVKSDNFIENGIKLPVLMYHHIDDKDFDDRYYYVKPSSFNDQMKYLYENGYTALTFDDIRQCSKYKKPILITFDDGYEDNFLNAFPVLKDFNMKATIFLISQFIDNPTYLKKNEIFEMKDVISFQSHTNCHANLKALENDLVKKECTISKRIIESVTKKEVTAISYPFGMYDASVIDTVKKYYTYGISGDSGYFCSGDDCYKIKRIAVTYNDSLKDFIKKVN